MERIRKESEKNDKERKEYEEELIKKRKEEVMKAHELLKKKREEDKKKYLEAKPKNYLTPKYLYKKLEERYQNEIMLPMLKEKKQQLAIKRNQCKSLNKDELSYHLKNYECLIARKEVDRQKKIMARKEQELIHKMHIEKYKTQIQERQIEEDRKQIEESKNHQLRNRELRMKMENYSNLVKEIGDVNIIRSKKHIDSVKTTNRIIKFNSRENVTELNKRVYERNAISIIKRRSHDISKNIKKHNNSICYSIQTNKKEVNKSLDENKKITVDYLSELRKKRGSNYGIPKAKIYNWMDHINDNKEKLNKIIDKTKLMEEEVMIKEKLLQMKGGSDLNPELGKYVSDMFVDVIKAKLAVLENYN